VRTNYEKRGCSLRYVAIPEEGTGEMVRRLKELYQDLEPIYTSPLGDRSEDHEEIGIEEGFMGKHSGTEMSTNPRELLEPKFCQEKIHNGRGRMPRDGETVIRGRQNHMGKKTKEGAATVEWEKSGETTQNKVKYTV